jgi:hypothetical protein
MKRFLLSLLLIASVFLSFTNRTNERSYDAYWFMRNQTGPLENLSWKLLESISKGELTPIDTNIERKMSKEETLYRLTPFAEKCGFSKEEVMICLQAGDFSVMSAIETKYSAKQLQKLINEGKDVSSKFSLIARPSFEMGCLRITLQEEILSLDTNAVAQKGTMRYILLMIPAFLTDDQKEFPLFRIRYEDFKQLKFVEEETFIEERAFRIIPGESELMLIDRGTKQQYKLSDLKELNEGSLHASLFKYFRGNITLKNTPGKK